MQSSSAALRSGGIGGTLLDYPPDRRLRSAARTTYERLQRGIQDLIAAMRKTVDRRGKRRPN